MEQPSKISINWRDNQALRDALGAKKVGDRCASIELKGLVVTAVREDGADLTYNKIAVAGYKPVSAPESKEGDTEEMGPQMSPASIAIG